MQYVLGIDQSTQGTKAILFSEEGRLVCRADRPHRQIITKDGWVEHDTEEIHANVIAAVKEVMERSAVPADSLACIGITNQRETSCAFDEQGHAVGNAIVWQDARTTDLCRRLEEKGIGDLLYQRTGIPLSPYFPSSRFAWLMENNEEVQRGVREGRIHFGTMDAWLVCRLTHGSTIATDVSNASRTQLFDLERLTWNEGICDLFGIPASSLPVILDSDACYGMTDFDGVLDHPVPVHAVLGDSHAALYGHGCIQPGMGKATYGTGSSVMLNTGSTRVESSHGLVTSAAWSRGGKTAYVLEGNINYSGAVITWLKDDLGLIHDPQEAEQCACNANKEDETFLVPAFSGLGAPHWAPEARAAFVGMSRTTGRNELVKAGLESIAFQVNDVLSVMKQESPQQLRELHADGGASRNPWLMQRESDLSGLPVVVSGIGEVSALGAAMMAYEAYSGKSMQVPAEKDNVLYPAMPEEERQRRLAGWDEAVRMVMYGI